MFTLNLIGYCDVSNLANSRAWGHHNNVISLQEDDIEETLDTLVPVRSIIIFLILILVLLLLLIPYMTT